MKEYLLDGHKLIYHLERVGKFLSQGDCFPLYMEISIIGRCNHKCLFCAYDYIGHPNRKLETGRLLKFIDEVAKCGLKSLLFSGEGEPLLHTDIERLVTHCYGRGIDVGIYTNGQFLTKALAEKLLPSLTFIRFSFNAGTKENYADIHRVGQDVFEKVARNIRTAVDIKREKKLSVDIGLQFVLLPENINTLFKAIKVMKKIGIDYFVIKPFVQQSAKQSYRMKSPFRIDEIMRIFDEAESLSDKNFRVIARRSSFKDYGKRNYGHCYGTSFISVLNSAGDIAACLPYWDKQDFIFGNIYNGTFKDIWLGKKRQTIKRFIEDKIDAKSCPANCRPHAVNDFLFQIKNPEVKHLNFI